MSKKEVKSIKGDPNKNPARVRKPKPEPADCESEAAVHWTGASQLIENLRDQYEQWLPACGESRRRLYALLGDIYAAIPLIEADQNELQKLRALANEDEQVRNSKRFKARDADSLDLMLVCVLSLNEKTRSTKSQWRSVLLAANLETVPPRTEAFQEWLQTKGGIVEVLRGELKPGSAKEGGSSDSARAQEDEALAQLIRGKFDFKQWASEVASSPPPERLKLVLDRETELHQGIGVLLVYAPDDGDPTQVRIVQKVGDAGVIKRVAAEVELGHVRNLTEEEKGERLLDRQLWTLNMVALVLARRLTAKITIKEFKAFQSAVRAITKDDQHQHRFFEGYSGVQYVVHDQGEFFTMKVKNPEFLEIDPGRYLGGARQGALIPYGVSEIGTPDGDEIIKQYISAHTEPWRFKANAS